MSSTRHIKRSIIYSLFFGMCFILPACDWSTSEDPVADVPAKKMYVEYDYQKDYDAFNTSRAISSFYSTNTDLTIKKDQSLDNEIIDARGDIGIIGNYHLNCKNQDSYNMHIIFIDDIVNRPDVVPSNASGFSVEGANGYSIVMKGYMDTFYANQYNWYAGDTYMTMLYAKVAIHELGHQRAGITAHCGNNCVMCVGIYVVHNVTDQYGNVLYWYLNDADWLKTFCSTCTNTVKNVTW